jgi:hypothetical protein
LDASLAFDTVMVAWVLGCALYFYALGRLVGGGALARRS